MLVFISYNYCTPTLNTGNNSNNNNNNNNKIVNNYFLPKVYLTRPFTVPPFLGKLDIDSSVSGVLQVPINVPDRGWYLGVYDTLRDIPGISRYEGKVKIVDDASINSNDLQVISSNQLAHKND